jgi:DNA-binding CsgD family transcriptional regulator
MEAVWELLRRDFHLYSETAAHAFLGWGAPEAARDFAELIRTSASAETALRFFDDLYATHDVVPILPQIQCPVLMMHRPGMTFPMAHVIEESAPLIPDCQLVLFEGDSAVPYLGDWRVIARTIYGFLGEDEASIRAAMGGRPLSIVSGRPAGLSAREREVIALVVRGLTNREIGEELVITEKTVENHVGRILDKLDLRSRTTLAAYAVEHGIARSA